MKKLKLLFAVAALFCAVSSVCAQSWTAPTITGEDPVSGTQYKVMNVGSGKYLDMGKAWFSWSTTAILSDNGINFTLTADGSNWKFIRTGTQGVFTSGNNIQGDAMHVDNTAHSYGITKMPNGYYHIHDAVGDASSTCWGYNSSFHATGVVAHADASSADWNCEWAFLTDASFTLFDARVNLYNLLLTAYGEGVNTDDASDVYNNASATLEQLNTAYNNLNQARYQKALASASDNNPIDITEWVLTNADFSAGNISGWETNYVSGQQAQNIGYQGATYTNGNVTISQFIEAWRPGATLGDGYLRQIVKGLPEGKYVLEADGISVWQNDASRTVTGSQLYITADGVDYFTNMSTANNKPEHFSVQFLNTGEGDVIFGLRTVSSNGNWLCADNFKVTFYGIDLSAYVTQLATEVATFEGYQSSIDATVYANLQEMVTEQNKTYTSSKTYAAAIANMQAINAYAAALVAATAIDQNAKMNSDVLSGLQTEIGKATSVTFAGIADATTALTAATANATTSIANYGEAKAILDAASTYDADGQASYATNETIAAIQTAYDNGTLEAVTAEQKAAAQAALATACKAQIQPADGCDMSPWIVNANFDGSIDGWTIDKKGNGWTGNPYKDGTIEYWTGSTTDQNSSGNFFDFYQVITSLPNGAYTISAYMLNSTNGEEGALWNGGGNAGLYGKTASDEKIVLVTKDGATNSQVLENYTTEEILVIDGELRLGVKNINPLTGRWFAADNFKLTYVRQLTAEEEETIAKANAVVAYTEALAAAQAIDEGSIPAAAYSALQDVITANTLADGTSNEYNAATTALSEAAAATQPLVAPYTAWKPLKAQADALVAVSTNDTEENTTLSSVISTQNTAVEAAATADEITTATAMLKAAMVTYATTAEPTNNECFDITFMIVNPHFTEGTATNPTGWTVNYPDGSAIEGWHGKELRTSTHNFEAFHSQFTLSQTIANLQKGTYKVTLQGFARHDDPNVTDKTNLFCGIVNQTIKDINAEYSTTSYYNDTKPALGDTNYDAPSTLGGNTIYRPNGMTGAYYWFQEENSENENKPFYTSEVQTLIQTDGDLTIGFKCETWTDWVIWDNFHLYYYGSAIAVELDEATGSSYTDDIENANVTLKKTIYEGWNTITIPFEASKEDFNASELYEYDNYSDETLNFKPATSIEPNVPYLMKATKPTNGVGTFTFNGITIKAATDLTTESSDYNFIGTYQEATVADGDYILGDDAFYRSNGGNKVKAYRAYIQKIGGGNNARLTIFIDGKATAIDAIDGEAIGNADIYNLAGQKVKNAQKGVYIQNGKKFVVK